MKNIELENSKLIQEHKILLMDRCDHFLEKMLEIWKKNYNMK